ncbi:MAG: AAA family ATPase [Chloroflexota bacterium]|nr:AAA family ATPase [Chloroflexota bacterium]
MSARRRASIALLRTGVPGLDDILSGGLPEYSFNLIAGTPGSGKTTLAHQIIFANATPERPALYLTVLGEPPIKMLRYQQQMDYFDPDKVGDSIHFVDLSETAMTGDLEAVLARIIGHVEEINPAIVVVDSFQTVLRKAGTETTALDLQGFVQRLAVYLTSWEATTFLLGDYPQVLEDNPVYTVADGILSLTQNVDRNSVVRKIQVVKSRGQAPMPGLHTFRITGNGLELFPRLQMPTGATSRALPRTRISSGVESLDELMGGGILAGDSVLVSGPSGTGKSVLGAQFIATGVRAGEPGVIAVFEEHPTEYMLRARSLGFDLEEMVARDDLRIIYLRPLDLSPDETLQAIRGAVEQIGAKRVVIDSLSGFELALAPTFRTDFRESLYRLVTSLTDTGVTVLMTMEIVQSYTDLQFSPYVISFLADDIILLRYVEIAGVLRKSLVVVKMRESDHRKEMRSYEITGRGLVVRESLREYRGIITGSAELREGAAIPVYPGLIAQEEAVLNALFALGEAAPDAVIRRTGIEERAVTPALERLVALGYASERGKGARTAYRPIAQAQ